MQNPNLLRIIKTLNDRPKAAITVFDSNNPMKKYSNLTKQALEETYGGINQFFEFLIEEGTTEIVVQPRLSNGSNFINLPGFNQFKVTIGALERNEMPTMLNGAVQQSNNQLPMPNINDVDLIKFKAFDYDRMSAEYRENKAKLDQTTKEYQELKENYKDLERELTDVANKGKGLNGLVENNKETIGLLLGTITEKLLAAPSATASSPAKQEIINVINKNDDSIAEYVSTIFRGLNNPAFANDLDALIQKYNLVHNNQ